MEDEKKIGERPIKIWQVVAGLIIIVFVVPSFMKNPWYYGKKK
jgi:hypothetical protein